MSALAIAARMKVAYTAGIVGKDMSFVFSEASFMPQIVEHISGVSNAIADELSRIYEPGRSGDIPAQLQGISPTLIPDRPKSWYKCLAA